MEEKKRCFTKLKNSMNIKVFRNFCKDLTEEYANSSGEFARSYFTSYYNISESCFYKILEYSIITNLIDCDAVFKIEKKAFSNSKANCSEAGTKTKAKFAKMRDQRIKYKSGEFQNNEIKIIAKDFANNPQITKKDFAKCLKIEVQILEQVLYKACTEKIVNDDIFKKIQKRSIENASEEKKEKVIAFFSKLREKRK